MKWNLRLAAAHRGIWKAAELQRLLAERGLVISAGKMSGPVVGPAGLPQARRPGRHLRGAGLRDRRAADPRTRQGPPRPASPRRRRAADAANRPTGGAPAPRRPLAAADLTGGGVA